MRYYIFDKAENRLVRDEDGEFITSPSNADIYYFLKEQGFKDEVITKDFVALKPCKILACEDLPQFQQSIDSLPQENKDRIDKTMEQAHLNQIISDALVEMGNPIEKVVSTSLQHHEYTYDVVMKIVAYAIKEDIKETGKISSIAQVLKDWPEDLTARNSKH